MNLQTTYLGLDLPHPLILGASPLVDSLDQMRAAEDAGAAAVTMHSLFEEQILRHQAGFEHYVEAHEESFPEALSYLPPHLGSGPGPEEHLRQIERIRASIDIPVIGSLNGVRTGGWIEYGKRMEEAGVHAIELNLYRLPADPEVDGATIEDEAVAIVRAVRDSVSVPLAVKISPFYTSLIHFARRLADAGADGLVIFNRFFFPDLDTENLEVRRRLLLSTEAELPMRLRWLSLLRDRASLDLAVTGGVHTHRGIVQSIMAGGDAVQLVSAPLMRGVHVFKELRRELEAWMRENDYDSIAQMKGCLSYDRSPDPEAIDRANYAQILQSWAV
jgi:dihydroorotate dehydrogenase (fumarate)